MRATVTQIIMARKSPVRHYAFLGDVAGIATLISGGYRFQADDASVAGFFNYNHPQLVLLGRVDLAEAKRAEEEAAGGLATIICGYGRDR